MVVGSPFKELTVKKYKIKSNGYFVFQMLSSEFEHLNE